MRDVRTAVGAYRETQGRLERQEDEAALLRRVCEADAAWQTATREAGILRHAVRALEQAQARERMEERRTRLEVFPRPLRKAKPRPGPSRSTNYEEKIGQIASADVHAGPPSLRLSGHSFSGFQTLRKPSPS